MKKKNIARQNARTRFAGISLSMAVMGMLLVLLAMADRSQPVVWVAVAFGILGIIGLNTLYWTVIGKLTRAARMKTKLKRNKPGKKVKLRQKKSEKGGKGKDESRTG